MRLIGSFKIFFFLMVGGFVVSNVPILKHENPFPESSTVDCHPDAAALIQFYNATNGDNWTNNTGWGIDCVNVCDWFGVSCENDSVVGISLPFNNLTGNIPSTIDDLANLKDLDLRNNVIGGSIPPTIGNLEFLEDLDLGHNNLSGNLPSQLGNLRQLRILNLTSNNAISGSIPSSLGDAINLEEIIISWASLNGGIPTSICNLPNLKNLDLRYNDLSGNIPDEIGNLSNIERLTLYQNNFTGEIPSTIGNLGTLRHLEISYNNLIGEIPTSFSGLNSVEYLNFSQNNLEGTFPDYFGTLPNLTFVNFYNNKFTGCIPDSYQTFCGSLADIFFQQNCRFEDVLFSEFCAGNACNPTLNLEASDEQVCAGEQVLIQGPEGSYTYFWSESNNNSATLATTLSQSKWIYLTVQNSKGCMKTDSIYIEVLPTPVLKKYAFLCSGSSVTIDGMTFSSGGVYHYTTNAGSGCDIQVTLEITEQSGTQGFISAGICPGTSVDINGTPYGSSGIYNQALTNHQGCDSILTIDITELPITYGYHLDSLLQGEVVFVNGVAYSTPGNYEQVLTNSFGCDSILTIEVIYACHPDYNALMAFYQATGGPNWSRNDGWGQDCNVCDWFGITCENNEVTEIQLWYNNLKGYLPTELSTISSLKYLTLDVNQITSIAPEIGNMLNLEGLYLRNNDITSIPSTLGNLNKLRNLNLSRNKLSGSITPEIANLNSLISLSLDHNLLSGNVEGLFNNLKNLERLDLSFNLLDGNFPELHPVINLRSIYLNDNFLEGCLPSSYINYCGSVGGSYDFTNNCTFGEIELRALCQGANCNEDLDIIYSSGPLCSGEVILLEASLDQPGMTYHWSHTGSQTREVPLTLTSPETIQVTVENAIGCTKVQSVFLDVIQPPVLNKYAFICDDETYSIDGNTYQSGGNYTYEIPAVIGCDTIVRLEVEHQFSTEENLFFEICETESVAVNGVIYTENGTYIQSLQNVAGCDSTLTINVGILQHTESYINTEVCEGENIFINGMNYSEGQSTSQLLTNTVGCDSTIYIEIEQLYRSFEQLTESICEGEELVVNGVSYQEGGSFVQTLVNAAGCDSILTIDLTVLSHTQSDFYSTICDGETIVLNGISYNETVETTQVLTNALGCDSIIYIQIEKLLHTSETVEESICVGDEVSYNGITYEQQGVFEQLLTNAEGCDSTLTIEVVVLEHTESLIETSICDGESVVINGIAYTETTNTSQTLSNAAGCDSTIWINILKLNHSAESRSESICEREAVVYNGTSYSQEGIYTQTLTNAVGCDSILTIEVEILLSTEATLDMELCSGETIVVNGETFGPSDSGIQEFTNAVGCDSILYIFIRELIPTDFTIQESFCEGSSVSINEVTYNQSGNFKQYFTNSVGCDSTLNIEITELYHTAEWISEQLCEGEQITINGIIYSENGIEDQVLQNTKGCDSILTVEIIVFPTTYGEIYFDLCDGESLTINGINYDDSGIFVQELSNSTGCDSILSIDIRKIFPTDETINASICEGDQFILNSEIFREAGNFEQLITNSVGCDSLISINIELLAPSEETIIVETCEGEVVTINNIPYVESGNFNQVLVNQNGCDSILYIQIISHFPTSEIINEEICNGESITINGIVYTETTTDVQNFTNVNGCDSTLYIQILEREASESSELIFLCEGEEYQYEGLILQEDGTYPFILTNGFGCDSTVFIHIITNTLKDTTLMVSICDGETYDFDGTTYYETGTYIQEVIREGCAYNVILDLEVKEHTGSLREVMICKGETFEFNGKIYETDGTYESILSNQAGCDSVVTFNITVAPEIITAIDTVICEGESIDINGQTYSTSGYFRDTIKGGSCQEYLNIYVDVLDPKDSTVTIITCDTTLIWEGDDYFSSGQYPVHVDLGNCSSINHFNAVFIDTTMDLNFMALCEGSIMILENIYIDKDGIYTINNGCGGKSQLEVKYINGEKIAYHILLEEGETVNYLGKAFNNAGTFIFEIGDGQGCETEVEVLVEFVNCGGEVFEQIDLCFGETFDFNGETLEESGTYVFSEQISSNCVYTYHLELNIEDFIGVNITGDEVICSGETTVLYVEGNYQMMWSNGSQTNEIKVNTSDLYSVTVTDEMGCTASASMAVQVVQFESPLIVEKTDPRSCDAGDGSIKIKVSQPEKFVYSTDNGITWSTEPNFNGLQNGSYTILLSDPGYHCFSNALNIHLSSPDIPELINVDKRNINPCTFENGAIEIQMQHFPEELRFSIDGGITWSEENIFEDLEVGSYSVMIRLENSVCPEFDYGVIDIKRDEELTFEILTIQDVFCDQLAIAEVNVLTGKPDFSVEWSNGDKGNIATELLPGIYFITVSDENGCSIIEEMEIAEDGIHRILDGIQDTVICESSQLAYNMPDKSLDYIVFKENILYAQGPQFVITEPGIYQIVAEKGSNCFTEKTFKVDYRDSNDTGLDFLMSAEGLVHNPVVIINIADPMPEEYHWVLPDSNILIQEVDSFSNALIFNKEGNYEITLEANYDGCTTSLGKTIRIYADSSHMVTEEETNPTLPGIQFFHVFPNPNNGQFYVEIITTSSKQQFEIAVFSLAGNHLLTRKLSGSNQYKEFFDLSGVPPGIYAVFLKFGEQVFQQNILILK